MDSRIPLDDRERIADALVAVAGLMNDRRLSPDLAQRVESIRAPLLALYSRYCASHEHWLGRTVKQLLEDVS